VTKRYLRTDVRELTLTGEGVDQDPAKLGEAAAARTRIGACDVTKPDGMLSRTSGSG
jgi:hypothetical protein